MYIDRIDLTLAAEDLTRVAGDFTSIDQFINTLPAISDGDRKHLSKLGMKNEGLVMKIIEIGRLNPNVISRGIDFAKIDRDILAREQLLAPLVQSQFAVNRFLDARLLLGIDIYAAALSIYHSLRRNAHTSSLRAAVDELAKGFARSSRKKTEPTPGSGTGSGSGSGSGIIVP